jgi:energy-coupling factor transport system ATP-binding protein
MMFFPENALIFNQAFVTYDTGQDDSPSALRDVSFSIPYGSWTAIVGSNGSGKSTLAKAAAGLYPLSSGELIRGKDLRSYIVLQHPDSQMIGETVLEEISLCLPGYSSPAEGMQQVQRLVERVGLKVSLHRPTHTLSGGQKQLLNLASCLAAGANLVILDEVTAMLDPASRVQVMEAVQRIHSEGTAILWITHRPEELGYAERVLQLEQGQLVFDGSSRDFFYGSEGSDQAPCERLGMELPYTVQVVKQLERKGYSLPERPIHPHELTQAVRIAACRSS